MYTENNEKRGVVKTTWAKIRLLVHQAEPTLASLIDDISPDSSYPLYLVYLPYGTLKGDTKSSLLPTLDGKTIRLSDPSLPRDMIDDLGYGISTSPLGMVIENTLEYYIEFRDILVPDEIVGPGYVFNKSILLNTGATENFSPNGIYKASAGARTAFSLPSISNFNSILKLNSCLGTKLKAPKKYSDHGTIFKNICSSKAINSDWRTCLLYFSKKWVDSMISDSKWMRLIIYLFRTDKKESMFESQNSPRDFFYTYIQSEHNMNTNSYQARTLYHLFKLALGKAPGYAPATSEEHLPLSCIQQSLYEFYRVDQHPTIMIPYQMGFNNCLEPVYYSLQTPTMQTYFIKKNQKISANKEIEALDLMIPSFLKEMSQDDGMVSTTTFYTAAPKITFEYYHNVPPNQGEHTIKHTKLLEKEDKRFLFNSTNFETKDFSYESQFLRGCVKISVTN